MYLVHGFLKRTETSNWEPVILIDTDTTRSIDANGEPVLECYDYYRTGKLSLDVSYLFVPLELNSPPKSGDAAVAPPVLESAEKDAE